MTGGRSEGERSRPNRSEVIGSVPPAAPGVELSVLIPSYNRADRLTKLLPGMMEALAELQRSGVATELIVVDNGSSDGTANAAREAAPEAQVIVLSPNRGASGARNAAARAARGQWLLLCDDDVEVTPDALGTLWKARVQGQCVVPQVRDLGGVLQNSVVARWHLGDLKLYELPEPLDEVAYPVSACLLVERDLYWTAGGFDERYQPQVYEDPAFGFALRKRGVSTRMVVGATVTHHVHGGASPEEQAQRLSEHARRYRQLIYKNRWLFNLLVLSGWRRSVVVALGLPRTLLQSLRTRSPGPIVGYGRAWVTFLVRRRGPAADRADTPLR